jgi:hypothetical protein
MRLGIVWIGVREPRGRAILVRTDERGGIAALQHTGGCGQRLQHISLLSDGREQLLHRDSRDWTGELSLVRRPRLLPNAIARGTARGPIFLTWGFLHD